MSKRQTQLEKAIQNLDEKIAALVLAKQHLLEQQIRVEAKPKRKLRAVAQAPSA